jgi:hypothetical protein
MKQRLGGLLFLAIGGAGMAWVWHDALTEGQYYLKMALLFPALAVLGLGMILFPVDMDRLKAEHGVERIEHFGQYPMVWKVLFVLALAASAANWYALSHP